MKLDNCPMCHWGRSIAVITVIDSVNYFQRYRLQCQHCHWKTKKSMFKWRLKRYWAKGIGEFTTRRERMKF